MNFRFVFTFAYMYGIRPIKRLLGSVIGYILTPFALLFIFRIIEKGALFPFAVVGGLVSIIATNSLYEIFDATNLRIESKIQDLLVSTRVTPTAYMLGLALSEFFYALPGIFIYISIGVVYGIYTPLSFAFTFCVLILLYLATTAFSFALASIPSHVRSTWGYTSITLVLFTLIPPIYYPYTLLPKPIFYLFLLVPSTSASVLIQNYLGLVPAYPYAIYILIGEAVLLLAIARYFTRWRSK